MRNRKKMLFILLILTLCFTATSCTENNTPPDTDPTDEIIPGGTDKTDYSKVKIGEIFTAANPITEAYQQYIYLGSYPKNEVKDATIIANLKNTVDVNSRGYYEYNGKEYAKVNITNTYTSTPTYTDDGYYRLTGYAPKTTYYFEVVPLLWQVLSVDKTTNVALLLSSHVIDVHAFSLREEMSLINGKSISPVNYEHSEIRAFLNGYFYLNTFTPSERDNIPLVTLDNSYTEYYYTIPEPINDTNDYVFLLSYKEVMEEEYGFSKEVINVTTDTEDDDDETPPQGVIANTESLSRVATPTDYARAKGVYANPYLNTYTSLWYLRNAREYTPFFAATVNVYGNSLWPFYTNGASAGIRVACYYQL